MLNLNVRQPDLGAAPRFCPKIAPQKLFEGDPGLDDIIKADLVSYREL